MVVDHQSELQVVILLDVGGERIIIVGPMGEADACFGGGRDAPFDIVRLRRFECVDHLFLGRFRQVGKKHLHCRQLEQEAIQPSIRPGEIAALGIRCILGDAGDFHCHRVRDAHMAELWRI